MTGIVWLASYPKSGNTWVRIFLANLFANPNVPVDINSLGNFVVGEMSADLFAHVAGKPVDRMSDDEIHHLRPKVHRMIAGLRPETVFAKTHNAIAFMDGVCTVTPEVTAGAIYIVRNVLDVVISYADHYGLSVDQAIEATAAADNRTVTSPAAVFQSLGSWSEHVLSWVDAPGLHLHVMRYEDLHAEPQQAFGALSKFLGVDAPRNRLRRAIRFSRFDELQRQEKRAGFKEKSRNSERFFRQGRSEQWKRVLTPGQIDAIVERHHAVMERFGYLP